MTAKRKPLVFTKKLHSIEEVPLFAEKPKKPEANEGEEPTEAQVQAFEQMLSLWEEYQDLILCVQHQRYSWTKTWLNTYNLLEAGAKKKAREQDREPTYLDVDLATEDHTRDLVRVCLQDIKGFDRSLENEDKDTICDELELRGIFQPVSQRILSVLIPTPGTKKK